MYSTSRCSDAVSLARGAMALLLALGMAGCSSSSPTEGGESSMPNFNGTYSLSGTYTGRPGNSVHGSLVISGQTNNTATVAVALTMTDHGNVFFALNTPVPGVQALSGPVLATVATNGSISLQYTGPEVIDGIDPADCCTYVLDLQGTLSGGLITGTWTLTRPDMPSFDSGTFAATR